MASHAAGHSEPVSVARTTLLAVDCRHPRLAARALRLSLAQCSYERVKLLTDAPAAAAGLDPRIEIVAIPPLRSAAEYSRFMLKDLLSHVDSDFVQVVQWDGYVANGAAWRGDFLAYDYIGARWFFIEDDWNVGNGGFSLRSRRLLEALQDLEIDSDDPEDHLIGRVHRGFLEDGYGIRFAPGKVADAYAFEGAVPTGAEFGFHRVFNLPYFNAEADLAEIIAALPDAEFCNEMAVNLVETLISLDRGKEALEYAQRIRRGGHLDRMLPEYRAKLDGLVGPIGIQPTE